jgi:hypothetical protein
MMMSRNSGSQKKETVWRFNFFLEHIIGRSSHLLCAPQRSVIVCHRKKIF